MVAPKIPVSPGQVGKAQDSRAAADAALRTTKMNEILAFLGQPPVEGLPAGARKSLDDLLDKSLPDLDAKKAAVTVRNALARDIGSAYSPGPVPADSTVIKGNVPLTQERKSGGFELVGAPRGEGHPVRALLESLGIDPGAFGPNVKAALETQKGKDVAHPDVWNKLGQSLAEAKVKDTPLSKVGALTGRSTAAAAAAGATAQVADLGLAKTARTQDQIAQSTPANNAESVMHSESLRDPSAAGKRDEAVNKLSSLLAYSGLSQSEIEGLRPTLDKVLKNGQLTAKEPADKAWAVVKNTHFEITGKKLPDGPKGVKKDAAIADGLSMSAAYQLQFLAESQTGKKLDSSAFLTGAATVVGNYVGATAIESKSSLKGVLGKVNFGATKSVPGGDSAKTQKTQKTKGNEIPKEIKAEAAKYAQEIGIHPDSQSTAHTMKDIETAFAAVIKPGASDKDVVKAALEYVNGKTGGTEATFAKHANYVLAGAADSPEQAKMLRDVALKKLTLLAAAGPDAYKQQVLAMQQGAGQMGSTPMTGVIGGLPPGMDLGRMPDALQGNYRQMLSASILADPSLSVEDKVMLVLMLVSQQMDQDRIRKMQEIADFDRTQAMRGQGSPMQAAAAQTSAAQTVAAKPGAAKPAAAAPKANGKAAASVAGAPPPPTPPKTAAAGGTPPPVPPNGGAAGGAPPPVPPNGAAGAAGGPPPGPPPGGPAPASGPVPGMGQPNLGVAPANEEAPKSREVMMAELDRINKMRDAMFQIMHQLIQKYDESTRGVIRSMQH